MLRQRLLDNIQPILLGIGFLLLVAISAGSGILVYRASADARLVEHTLTVQERLSALLLDVRRAESGQRGYLFTNNTAYLDDYDQSRPDAERLIAQLRELIADNPKRQTDLDSIAQTVAAKFAELSRTIESHRAGDVEGARALVFSGQGRELMDSLRRQIEAAIDDEGRLLDARTQQSRQTNRELLISVFIGAALILLVGIASITLVSRTARQREAARQELADINANLELIVAHRTAGLTEANEEIQRFAYVVSHDLRSPLVNVMGFTSELEALGKDLFARTNEPSASAPDAGGGASSVDRLAGEFDEALRFIKSSTAQMDRLIRAILTLSREGRRQFRPEPIDMKALFDSIAQNVAHRTQELGAALTVGAVPPVDSDRLALEQIFANLVDNALKYGRPGTPLRIDIGGHSNARDVIYEIRDNGRGIAEADHQRVFELFRRSGAQDRPGEGIGLAHVRALVRRLGGTIRLTSELGSGCTFAVTLPRHWIQERTSA